MAELSGQNAVKWTAGRALYTESVDEQAKAMLESGQSSKQCVGCRCVHASNENLEGSTYRIQKLVKLHPKEYTSSAAEAKRHAGND